MDEGRPKDASFSWTQVTIKVSAAAQEGLANLLFELGAKGLSEQEEGYSCPCITTFFPSDSQLPSKLQAITRYLGSLTELGIVSGTGEIRILPWRDEGQEERWKDFFKPLLLGKRLVIKPTWEDYLSHPSEVIVEMDPGRAFGTGRHPTTTLCLRFLERRVKGGERILDVGAGSGILAIAAAKLGAGQVTALEIGPESAQVARGNVKLNRVEEKVEIVEGTLSSLPPGTFQVVVVNLTVEEILPLIRALSFRLASPDGILFLSGILRGEMNPLFECLEGEQLSVRELELQGEWAGVGVTKKGRQW